MRACVYARYSSDLQREQSIEDQHRVAERLAERHGFTVVARFSDRAVSGGTTARADYQRMLAAARRHEFDVIVAEDTSRLWRNLAEQSPRLAEFADLGIAVVTHDLDTRHESAEIMGAVGGAMATAYRREIGRRTRRGLEGNARNGKSAGGRSYGYVPAAVSGTGQMEIDQAQAEVVRQIFTWYAGGWSPRAIAEELNRRATPSPGAMWAREARRKRGWVSSAIYNNPARQLGILCNPLYTGLVIWNRMRWVRSAADSSKRRCVPNPRKEWITRQDERLRIVSVDLWQRAQARQSEQSRRIGEGVRRGLSKGAAIRAGSGNKYLLSGLLRCAHCGSAYAISGAGRYACSGHTNGGDSLCSNNAIVWREVAEEKVTAGIKRDLLSPVVIEEICKRARALLRASKPTAPDHSARIAQLKSQAENIAEAISTGALRASPTLAARLAAAEAELERLQAEQAAHTKTRVADVTRLVADLPKRAARAVEQLERTLASGDITLARQEIRQHVGAVTVEADELEIRLYGEHGVATTLLRAVGGDSHASIVGSGGPLRAL